MAVRRRSRSPRERSSRAASACPAMIRWPGHVPADSVQNGIFSGLDWLPTFVAAAGNPNITEELLKGKKIGDRTYKNHLDGYNQMAAITGKGPSARHEIFYLGESTVGAVRIDDYKYPLHRPARRLVGREDPSGRALHHQPAPGSVRAHGLAEQWDEGRRAAILRLVQVPVLALRVRPAGDGARNSRPSSTTRRCSGARASISTPSRRRWRRGWRRPRKQQPKALASNGMTLRRAACSRSPASKIPHKLPLFADCG